jgi:hypothetical protein
MRTRFVPVWQGQFHSLRTSEVGRVKEGVRCHADNGKREKQTQESDRGCPLPPCPQIHQRISEAVSTAEEARKAQPYGNAKYKEAHKVHPGSSSLA